MRRSVLLLASMALAMLLACGVALALPSETPDKTPMVNGTVRAIEQVGTNVWLGGKFTQVKQCSNPNKPTLNVSNLAVIDSNTNECKNFALPTLGGTGAEVWDMMKYGGTGPRKDDVLIAGKFSSGSSSTQKNLVRVDGTTGNLQQLIWAGSMVVELASRPSSSAAGSCGPKRRPPSTLPATLTRRRLATATSSSTVRRSGRRAPAMRWTARWPRPWSS